MTQVRIIEKQFETPLGVIHCGFKSDLFENSLVANKYENGQSEIFNTQGHKIEVITFKIKLPLYNGESVADSCGWIFRIEKINEAIESIETYCCLQDTVNNVLYSPNTGEYLDAIEASNLDWILHIGTEDGEILNSRAEIDDWFPTRLKNKVDFNQTISEMVENGFKTKIPVLYKGEKMHVQYLTAFDKRDDQKVNTWLAVDEFKRNLENWIGIW